MPRKRLYELAKEWGIETRQLLTKLEQVGVHGKKPQSTLTEQEIALVRPSEEAKATPAVVMGEEKLVAERVVTEVDQRSDHLVTAREEVRESRIRPNVIRRRVTRVEVHEESAALETQPAEPTSIPPPSEGSFAAPPVEEPFSSPSPVAFELPPVAETPLAAPEPPLTESESPSVMPEPPPSERVPLVEPEHVAPVETSESVEPGEADATTEPVESTPSVEPINGRAPESTDTGAPAEPVETQRTEPLSDSSQPVPSREEQQLPGVASPPAVSREGQASTTVLHKERAQTPPAATAETESEEASRSSRILGRIDLGKIAETKPARPEARPRTPSLPVPSDGPSFREPVTDGDKGLPEAVSKRAKKRKIIRKPDLPEVQERDVRLGRGTKRKRVQPGKEQRQTEITIPKASKRVIRISEVVTVGDLARALGVKASEVIKKLIGLGTMATINQVLDADTAALVAADFDYTVENVAFDADSVLEAEHDLPEDNGKLEPRPPVVTIMGHVDHGKTSLLDAIRQTNVTAREHGGITQHIGAYSVQVEDRRVTFLDTPGHEAFTAMRARGAEVTDIVTLVVAADDGVMPQTVEAINHARAAGVPLIVAANKIDKSGANIDQVKRELMAYGLVSEELGGDTIFAAVSAKTGEGIPHLLEMILLQADIMEFRARPGKLARGTIVEAKLDRGRGPVATVLVQEGELKVGEPFVCGTQYGRVRAMIDSWGNKVETASPSMPVEILGLTGVPEAGEVLIVVNDEAKARQVAEHRRTKRRETELTKSSSRTSLKDFYQQIQAGEIKELRVIIKADVQGSVEAISDALNRLSTNEVKLTILHASVGGISESDVLLASASQGIIIGFNIRPESKAMQVADREGVEIRLYNVIYEVLADVRAALEGMLEPTFREKFLGRAEVRQVFTISHLGLVAGCMVHEGRLVRGAQVRLVRDRAIVYEGRIATLRHFKDDVREVVAGSECGVGLEHFQDIKAGDNIEAYELEQVLRRLETRPQHEMERRV